MNNFKVLSTDFFNEYLGLTGVDTTDNLQGNVGEIMKLVEVIEVSTIVNEKENLPIVFNLTAATLTCDFINYIEQGLYIGAAISIELDSYSQAATVVNITGSSNQTLVIDSTAATAIGTAASFDNDLPRTDVVIKVTTRPEYLQYKYGIIPNSFGTNNYNSPLDGQEQVYYAKGITGVASDMIWAGGMESTNMGSVTIKFDATRLSYIHQFTLEHTFVIPYYTPQQLSNILNGSNPTNLRRGESLKYCNGFFFSASKNDKGTTFEDNGKHGNVGWFDENFSGQKLFYGIEDFAVSNSLGTGKLEATVANTVTFKITSDTPTGFVGGEKIILYHTKLAESTEFENNRDSFDTVFMRSKVTQTEGGAAAASGIFSAVTVTLATGKLEVSAVVTYSASQQLLLSDTKYALMYATIATQDTADASLTDRANLKLTTGTFSKDEDVRGVISNWVPNIYTAVDYDSGTAYTDFNGYNGDLLGQTFSFSTNMSFQPLITGALFAVVLDNGTTYKKLYEKSFPINQVQTTTIGSTDYQILSLNIQNDFNLDSSLLLNKIILSATIPASETATQDWVGAIGFQVPWREWIANGNIPTDFIDYAEPNNNQNNRTSNYSGVNGYTIKTLVRLQVQTPGTNSNIANNFITTFYECFSDESSISDFDTDAGAFVSTPVLYDVNNEIITDLYSDQKCKLVFSIAHTSGTLSLANLTAMIWTNTADGTEKPWYLHSDIDMTNPNNPLQPSDTLLSGNSQYVEVVSTNNLVTLTCYTNEANIIDGIDYKFYARLQPK